MAVNREIARLQKAWMWQCPSCFKVCAISADFDEIEPEDESEIRDSLGIPEYQPVPEGQFIILPEIVTCQHCGEVADVDVSEYDDPEGDSK